MIDRYDVNRRSGRHAPRTLSPFARALMAAALIAASASAGPILFRNDVPSQVKSLSGIKRLRVAVAPLTGVLVEAEILKSQLRSVWIKSLTDAGIEVVDDENENAPTLILRLMTTTDEEYPDAVGYCALMALRQSVDLRRITHSMAATTFAAYRVGLENRKNLQRSIDTSTRDLIKEFIWVHGRNERRSGGD